MPGQASTEVAGAGRLQPQGRRRHARLHLDHGVGAPHLGCGAGVCGSRWEVGGQCDQGLAQSTPSARPLSPPPLAARCPCTHTSKRCKSRVDPRTSPSRRNEVTCGGAGGAFRGGEAGRGTCLALWHIRGCSTCSTATLPGSTATLQGSTAELERPAQPHLEIAARINRHGAAEGWAVWGGSIWNGMLWRGLRSCAARPHSVM